MLACLLRDVARHADDRRLAIPATSHYTGIHQDAPAVGPQQRQRAIHAGSSQDLGDHTPGHIVGLGRVNGPDRLAEQSIAIAQPLRHRRVVVQDAAIQVEHEQIIGDGLKQALQISPLSGSLFLGQQTLQGLRELANQRFQGGHGQLPDHPDLLAGQVETGDRFTADVDWQHHQRSDTFLDQCRFLNQ